MAHPLLALDPGIISKMLPTRGNRKKITYGTLWFCAAVIGYIVVYGDPANVLHITAMEYAFMLAGGAAFGYTASAVADNATVFKQTPKE